jgi:general secretion pathway protein D
VIRGLKLLGVVIALSMVAAGCAAGRAFRAGNLATRAGDLDQAVAHYRAASQASPDNANYKIALERAMLAASRAHLDRAREFEGQDQLDAALSEYRLASEYDPTNRQAAAKVVTLDKTIRERVEAARPRPAIEQLRERARAASAPPILNPASRELLRVSMVNSSARDVLNFIGSLTGINVTYDREFVDRPTTINLDGVTLETALNLIMTMNQYSYKVLNERSIFVFPDTNAKHIAYDDQVIQTFYVSHADVTELSQLLSSIIRLPGIAVQPIIQFNKTNSTITIRATSAVAQIIERLITQNDKPRAEIVVDVEILEVDRTRAKQYGLNLSDYAIGAVFSPEVSPGATSTTTTSTTGGTTPATSTSGTSTGPTALKPPPPFNLNTISLGVKTSDFYLAVPTMFVQAMETDSNTRLIAKPQLRGAEGSKLTLDLGQSIPVIQTSYTPLATGGAGVNPLSSYNYKDVGVKLEMTPRVTLEGDIVLDLLLDNSSLGSPISVAGVTVPSFGQRKVTTRLRLRDGESNLLAGLLNDSSSKDVKGFPGAIHLPILSQLFSSNNITSSQTDVVMLLTPHIIRTSEINENDLKPIYIGSQQNLGVGGPPPLIAGVPEAEPAAAGAAAAPAPGAPPQVIGTAPGGVNVAAPPGSSPVPGTVVVPPAPPAQPAPPQPTPPPQPPAPPPASQPPPTGAAAQPPSPAEPPVTTAGVGLAPVIITPPATGLRVGAGPYNVPISISNVSRLSTISLTLTFDPTLLRVRAVLEGSFMRSGGANATFTQQAGAGRVDITIARAGDATGASGTGLLSAIVFDAIAPGTATLTLSGAATGPGGTAMGLQLRPVTLSIQP